MQELLLEGLIIHADETTIQIPHEEGRKPTSQSQMWVYCNGKMNDRSIIIFDYHPTRKGEHAAVFLHGFNGYLIYDGYDAYNAVTGAKRCGGWTHTRRHFVEVLPKISQHTSHLLQQKLWTYATESTTKKDYWQT